MAVISARFSCCGAVQRSRPLLGVSSQTSDRALVRCGLFFARTDPGCPAPLPAPQTVRPCPPDGRQGTVAATPEPNLLRRQRRATPQTSAPTATPQAGQHTSRWMGSARTVPRSQPKGVYACGDVTRGSHAASSPLAPQCAFTISCIAALLFDRGQTDGRGEPARHAVFARPARQWPHCRAAERTGAACFGNRQTGRRARQPDARTGNGWLAGPQRNGSVCAMVGRVLRTAGFG